ncbi:MAG: hypothetical protein U9R38_03985 [Candidatus Margulisiibacteriota bacterium]|nr:hypothetical protein [Candidatus Margulisiibacteriota bacterium]
MKKIIVLFVFLSFLCCGYVGAANTSGVESNQIEGLAVPGIEDLEAAPKTMPVKPRHGDVSRRRKLKIGAYTALIRCKYNGKAIESKFDVYVRDKDTDKDIFLESQVSPVSEGGTIGFNRFVVYNDKHYYIAVRSINPVDSSDPVLESFTTNPLAPVYSSGDVFAIGAVDLPVKNGVGSESITLKLIRDDAPIDMNGQQPDPSSFDDLL